MVIPDSAVDRLYIELLDLRTALASVPTPVAQTANCQIPVVDVLPADGTDWRWVPNGLNI